MLCRIHPRFGLANAGVGPLLKQWTFTPAPAAPAYLNTSSTQHAINSNASVAAPELRLGEGITPVDTLLRRQERRCARCSVVQNTLFSMAEVTPNRPLTSLMWEAGRHIRVRRPGAHAPVVERTNYNALALRGRPDLALGCCFTYFCSREWRYHHREALNFPLYV